jgi:excisionase family DNA binding protein
MQANPKIEKRDPKRGCHVSVTEGQLLTREELAVVLGVSVHTVDRMLAEEEIPCIRLRGWMVRFYMPEVIRVLVATAATRKRARGTEVA